MKMTLDNNPILYSDHDQHHIHGKGTSWLKEFQNSWLDRNQWTNGQ